MRPSGLVKQVVETLNLKSWLSTETAKIQLAKAGFRGARAEYAAALAGDTKGEIDRATVELKLRDVGGEVPPPKPAAGTAQGDS